MLIILLLFTLVYILQEGRELLRSKNWQEALLGLTIIAVSMVYGIDYIREADSLPHPGTILEMLQPWVDAYFSYFNLPT